MKLEKGVIPYNTRYQQLLITITFQITRNNIVNH